MSAAPYSVLKPLLRSLLQKAVRRGAVDLVDAAAARLAHHGDSAWLHVRAAVIGFEECWPHMQAFGKGGQALPLLLQVARNVKDKEAAGLGSLAYALSQGDRSALTQSPDPVAVKITAAGLERPSDFFNWALRRCDTATQTAIVQAAAAYMPRASWPWDKAFMAAAAYLAGAHPVAAPQEAGPEALMTCPLWVAVDKHTPQGRACLRQTAQELGISLHQLEWACFYQESAASNALRPTLWWEAEAQWRLAQVGLGRVNTNHEDRQQPGRS